MPQNKLEKVLQKRKISHADIFIYNHEGEKSFECDLCESKFTQKESLKAHIASVHEEEKLFECDIYENAFTQKENLIVHIALIHEGERLFECDM